jgi:hypothetical protein
LILIRSSPDFKLSLFLSYNSLINILWNARARAGVLV